MLYVFVRDQGFDPSGCTEGFLKFLKVARLPCYYGSEQSSYPRRILSYLHYRRCIWHLTLFNDYTGIFSRCSRRDNGQDFEC